MSGVVGHRRHVRASAWRSPSATPGRGGRSVIIRPRRRSGRTEVAGTSSAATRGRRASTCPEPTRDRRRAGRTSARSTTSCSPRSTATTNTVADYDIAGALETWSRSSSSATPRWCTPCRDRLTERQLDPALRRQAKDAARTPGSTTVSTVNGGVDGHGEHPGRRAGADPGQRHPPRHRRRQPVLVGQDGGRWRPRRSGPRPAGWSRWPTWWTRPRSCWRTGRQRR